jgi:aspartyl-tRNA(Asn)/glutamyl-tRNA(Gln) amidotransferase subunit C
MTVSRDEVLRIASLARITLDDARVDSLARELSAILGHVEVLSTVDTAAVQPVEGVGAGGTPLRKDVSAPSNMTLALEAIAPEMKDGFFIVPRLATHEDAPESGA